MSQIKRFPNSTHAVIEHDLAYLFIKRSHLWRALLNFACSSYALININIQFQCSFSFPNQNQNGTLEQKIQESEIAEREAVQIFLFSAISEGNLSVPIFTYYQAL